MSLFNELKRRNVFKVAAAYVIVAWLLLQISDTLVPALRLPDWFHSGVAFVLILGFPVAMIFAWAFELTPEGLKKEKEVDRSQSETSKTGRTLDFAIIGLLAVTVIYLVWDKFAAAPDLPEAKAVAEIVQAGPDTPVEKVVPVKSIAVLPFTNMSDDASNEFFSDGISEEILNALAHVKELKVAGRTSSFAFKGRNEDLRLIGETLNVSHILEGSVRKAGNTVRITAQLVTVKDGYHVWSDTYDRELTDIFAIQDEIAAAILGELKAELIGNESLAASRTDPQVYELYLKGRDLCGKWGPQEMLQGVNLLQQAVKLDPQYAAAHAQLAQCLVDSAFFEYMMPVEIESRARTAALEAVQLDDQLAEAHVALGAVIYYLQFDLEPAESEYLKALELNPNSTAALLYISWFYGESGRFDESLGPTEHLVRLDPLSAPARNALGQIYYLSRDFDRAIQEYERALELNRGDPSLIYYLASAHLQKGQIEKALALFKSAVDYSDTAPLYLAALGHAYGVAGMEEEARQVLEELQKAAFPSPYNLAIVNLGLGEHEQAINWLEKAYEARNGHLLYINEGPVFDALRNEQRFISLLQRMGW